MVTFGLPDKLGEPKLEIIKLYEKSPVELFAKLYQSCENVYLLESVEGPKKLAEYSFIGFNPRILISIKNGNAEIRDSFEGSKTVINVEEPLLLIKELVGMASYPAEFRLVGGAVGYISYDAVRYWEKLPEVAVDDLNFPDFEMGLFADGIVYNHKSGDVYYYCRGENRLSQLYDMLQDSEAIEELSYSEPKPNLKKEEFEKTVVKAKDYIEAGDIFQVVLSKRYGFRFGGGLIHFYKALRRINPSPYMYFLKMGTRQIVGSSPEMLVRVENNMVETFPIAGTRPRVEDGARNEALKQELLLDPKECAEHVMLVDLARNDVGRVAEFGTVSVPEFMRLYEYSHVQHMVSRVVGRLRKDCDCYDALRAVFPAGTVSGAPKVRAMEIIEESEPTRRGPYAGAVGYFSFNGAADFAITIRTLVADGDKAYIQAGAGIVADSNPEKEWYETEHKAAALLKALRFAAEGVQA